MDQQEKFGVAHILLLVLTLAFVGALLWASGRDRADLTSEGYSVAVEKSVSAAELVPEQARIDVNTATAEELETLKGIGPALAQAIVDYRDEHGPFTAAEELTEVSGIGPAKLEAIRESITLGGEDA